MIIVFLLAGMVAFGSGTVIGYNIGATANDHEWLVKERNWEVEKTKLHDEKEKEIKENKDRHDAILMRVINDQQKAEQERDAAFHRMLTGGMYVSTEEGVCPESMPGEAESPSKSSNAKLAARKLRILGKSEQDIREMIRDAQEMTDKYKALYKVCAPLLEIVE